MTAHVARTGLPVRALVRPTPSAGTLAAGLAVLLSITGLLVVTRAGAWSSPDVDEVPVDAAIGLSYPLAAAVVLRGNRALGRVLLVVGLAAAVVTLATAVAATATSPSALTTAAAWLQSWLWVPAFAPLLLVLPLMYPDGRLLWRPVGLAGIAGTALLTVAVALHDTPFQGQILVEKPFSSVAAAIPLAVAGGVLALPALLSGPVALLVRLRRAQGLARRQIVVFLGAAAVVLVEALAHGSLPEQVSDLTQPAAVVLPPLAVGVAVTRHRLYDLDLTLLRLLVGAALVACLAGAYLTVFAVLVALAPTIAVPVAAGLTGLVVHPLGVQLSRAGDRLFYGDRADPYVVLAGLTARLSDGTVADVPREVCEAVVGSLRLRAAELVVAERSVALVGAADGPQEEFALRSRGELVGRFVVTVRAGELALDVRDRELLQSLADAAAPALAAVQLYEDLQASRAALVAGREEERRRLRRDLHDGVGAALAGARLQLESARDLVADPVAVRMLDAASGAVEEAVDDVRRLTEDLRPPALDELGLAGCLIALADRTRTPALEVVVDVVEPPSLPAAVEVACYRIAAEALANAARHAHARRIDVRLTVHDAAVVLEVCDDGAGLPEQRRPGVGTTSMRQRAEELGGHFALDSGPGTTVRAMLPT